jgi:cytochrome P450
MIFLYLAENPEIEKKARSIIDSVIKNDKDITIENLKKLEYIEWMLIEALRLGTPLFSIVPRISTKDHMLLDIPVSKETMVATNFFGNQYSSKYFKDPETFRPERW